MAGDNESEGRQREGDEASGSERARHWAAFYQELISYEERILESMRDLSAGMSAGEKEAIKKTNLEPLEELIDDFRRRLELWRHRIETEERSEPEQQES
jgi:hypothetical protein